VPAALAGDGVPDAVDRLDGVLVDLGGGHGLGELVAVGPQAESAEGALGRRVARRLLGLGDADVVPTADRHGHGEGRERGAAHGGLGEVAVVDPVAEQNVQLGHRVLTGA